MASPVERSETGREIILARWSDRFLAWLIDFIITSIALLSFVAYVFELLSYASFTRDNT
jgi:hypothetical protein